MINAKIGTARTNAANRRWSCATAQMATRLPTTGKRRYSASTYGLALVRRFRCCALGLQSLRARRRVDDRGRSPVRLLVLAVGQERRDHHDGGEHHQTGDGTKHEQQFAVRYAVHPAASISVCPPAWPPACPPQALAEVEAVGGGGRTRGACLPIALEPSHVGDDRPPVRRRDRPAVRRHQARPVRDDVEDLPVRVLQDLLLVEGGGGDVASLEQDPLAVPRASWQGWQ